MHNAKGKNMKLIQNFDYVHGDDVIINIEQT